MKYILTILMMLHMSVIHSQKDTIIYIGDPMCSWCYGFSPELDKIKAAFPETPFEMIMGGLRAGGTETMLELKGFLKEHWQDVQKASGRAFNYNILSKNEVLYDTEMACRAVIVAGQLKPEAKYEYFKAAQESFYFHNNLPNDLDTYINLAIKAGIDPELFHKKLDARQSKMDAYSEFELASSMGVTGFPSIVAKIGGKLYLVTNGYQKADKIIKLLENRGLK